MKTQWILKLICLAAAAEFCFGQTTTATIAGNVTDSSGAAISGAKVTGVSLDTKLSRTVATQSDGSYSLLFLPIGTYRLEISAAGFKKFEQTGIVLEVNRNAKIDAALQVGALTETVEVTADAGVVETTQPSLGQMITNADIETMPLVNRDVYTLLTLTAGVDTTAQATDSFGAPMQVTVVNGSPNSGIGAVNYNLDGGSNTNGLRNTGNVAPNPDAVQEFRVTTSSYPADEGRFGGGTVTMITKSGTNALHGSLFEFIRNSKLNANRWVPGGSNLTKDPLHRNQFGGTAGGPIIRNKTFIFGSYSGLRERTTIYKNDATPLNAAERGGDLTGSGGTTPVDPLTGIAFPGRLIPVTRIDPVVKTIMDRYLPLPNVPGSNRFEVQKSHPRDTDEILVKVDHSIGNAHRVTGSLFYSTGADTTGLIGNIDWVDRRFQWSQYNYNLRETWIVSPNKINEFRVAYIRNFGGRVDLPQISLADLGSKFQPQGTPSLAQIQVSGRFNMNSALAGPLAGSNQYQVRDIFSLTTGRQNIRFGGEAVLEKMIHDALLTNYGDFRFTTSNPRGTKNAVADWLLGFPATMAQDAPTTKIDNSWYFGFFVQDDFRIHPRLTLNLGARWDIQPPITDPHDRFDTFVPGKQSVIVPKAPAGLLFPGDPGVKRGIVGTDWNNISPRIGISWDPFGDRKMAIRAAGGIFYGSISGNEWNTSSDNQPFAIRQTFNDVYSISDPYRLQPGGVSPFPYSYDPKNPRFAPPSAVVAIDLGYTLPYSYQYNAAIQRQLTNTTSFTVAYVGTLTHRIPIGPDQNYPVLTPTATTGNVNARRPYLPGILSTVGLYKSLLNSAYHGLQITVDKRFSHNFQVKGYYTFGKSLDYINTQNSTLQAATDWNNIGLDRGRTNNDRRQSAVISGIWQLNYFRKAPVYLRAVVGGWSLSTIASFRSGAPLSVTSGSDSNFDGNSNDRADLIGNPFLDPNRARSAVAAQWFNIAAFSKTPLAINSFDGTAGRNILDGPGLKNVDMGIFRDFKITESKKLQFRAEATNALNMVNLSNPGTNANSPSTFGIITTAASMRQAQLGLRLTF